MKKLICFIFVLYSAGSALVYSLPNYLEKRIHFDALQINVSALHGLNIIHRSERFFPEKTIYWNGLVTSVGLAQRFRLSGDKKISFDLGLSLYSEFFHLPRGYISTLGGSDRFSPGLLLIISMRLYQRVNIHLWKQWYFGTGLILSSGVFGVYMAKLPKKFNFASLERVPYLIPYASFHLVYIHDKAIIQSELYWGIELNSNIALNNEKHFEIGARLIFFYMKHD